MRRVSSRLTPLYKWAFPVMWFVILAAMVMVALMVPGADSFQRVMSLATAIFMAVFGYFIFRKLVFDLVDEVVDEGDLLVVKNRGKSDRIALSDIRNVSYSALINPARVTLVVAQAQRFRRRGDLLRSALSRAVCVASDHQQADRADRRRARRAQGVGWVEP